MNKPPVSLKPSQGRSGRGPWPYVAPLDFVPPATFPNGDPLPKISIITPSYNQGQYIEQTILSIINQRYPNLEFIIMDGGSTDETVEVITKYESHIHHWVSEKDKGQSNAINKGMSMATGDILTWLNSDDMLAPEALVAMALAFHQYDADIVAGVCQLYSDGVLVDQHLTSCEQGLLPIQQLLDLDNQWMKGRFFFQPEVFFTRRIWEKAGGKVREDLFYSMDYELWLRMAQAGAQLKVIGRPIAKYRVHKNQKTYESEKFLPELRKVAADFRKETIGGEAPVPKDTPHHLKIVTLDDICFNYGAGIAHKRIATSLAAAGHQVIPLSILEDTQHNALIHQDCGQRLLQEIEQINPDIIVIGNMHGVPGSAGMIKRVAKARRALFIMHDMWLLTGRCAYFGGCDKYLTGCDADCPTPHEYPKLDPEKISDEWEAKTALLTDLPELAVGADSSWVLETIEGKIEHIAKTKQVKTTRDVIRYGLPPGIFKPLDKRTCREILNLPQDRFLLLFSCSSILDKRKGGADLEKAVELLGLEDLTCVSMGFQREGEKLSIPHLIEFGYNKDVLRQAMLFSAVDLFVGPSQEEAFGQVFIEASACGTPSVGYPVGGIPEALRHGISGEIAEQKSPAALASTIEKIYLNRDLRTQYGFWGRIHVESEFSYISCAHSVLSLIRRHLNSFDFGFSPKFSFMADTPELPQVFCINNACLGRASPPPGTYTTQSAAPLIDIELELEKEMLAYYKERFGKMKTRGKPWYFSTRAWRIRSNIKELEKRIIRGEMKNQMYD